MSSLNGVNTHRILHVEDDTALAEQVRIALKRDADVVTAASLAQAKLLLEKGGFDMILLDLSLPDGDGLKLCAMINEREDLRDIPVIMITGRGDIEDKVLGFSLGIEDYLVKPFSARELRARIEAKLLKIKRRQEVEAEIVRGNLRVQVGSQRAYVVKTDTNEPLTLTPLEFKLLVLFMRNRDRVYSREQLIAKVWGSGVHILDRTVDSHISGLRAKLSDASHNIRTIRGVGYQMAELAMIK